MVPSVELSPQTFARLQAHAVPLVDSIETVINRLADFYESNNGTAASTPRVGPASKSRRFSPLTPPDLKHTKVLSVEFCGKRLDRAQETWNGLLLTAIREAKAKAKSPANFKNLVVVNFVDGEKSDEGFRYLPDIGISVQGQDANYSWRGACHIAQQLSLPLQVTFAWRQKDGAAFPGEIGQMSVGVA
jgi:hypothetical protein